MSTHILDDSFEGEPPHKKGDPVGRGLSWCGKQLWRYDWVFTSVDHAAMNGREDGRLVACKKCTRAIIKGLTNGQQ